MSTDACIYEEATPLAANCTSLHFETGTIYSNGTEIGLTTGDTCNETGNTISSDVPIRCSPTSSTSTAVRPCRGVTANGVTDGKTSSPGDSTEEELTWNMKLMNRSRPGKHKKSSDNRKSVGDRLTGSISKIFGKLQSSRLSLPAVSGLRAAFRPETNQTSDGTGNPGAVCGEPGSVEAEEQDDDDCMWSDTEFEQDDVYANVEDNGNSDSTAPRLPDPRHHHRDIIIVPMATSRHRQVDTDTDNITNDIGSAPKTTKSRMVGNKNSETAAPSSGRRSILDELRLSLAGKPTEPVVAVTSQLDSSDDDYLEPQSTSNDVVGSCNSVARDIRNDAGQNGNKLPDNYVKCRKILPPVLAKRDPCSPFTVEDMSSGRRPVPAVPSGECNNTSDTPTSQNNITPAARGRPYLPPPRQSVPPQPALRSSSVNPLYPDLSAVHINNDPTTTQKAPVAWKNNEASSSDDPSINSSALQHSSCNQPAISTVTTSASTSEEIYESPDGEGEMYEEYEEVDKFQSCFNLPLPPIPSTSSTPSPPSKLRVKARSHSLGNALLEESPTVGRPTVKPKPTTKHLHCAPKSTPAALSTQDCGMARNGVAILTGLQPSTLQQAASSLNQTLRHQQQSTNLQNSVISHQNGSQQQWQQRPPAISNNDLRRQHRPAVTPRSVSVGCVKPLPTDPDDLDQYCWYFGSADRTQCEAQVHSVGKDGTFVVRKSQRGGQSNPYALTMLYGGATYNLLIRQKDNSKYALGSEKPDEHVFSSVAELISFYRNNPIQLTNDRTTTNIIGKVFLLD